MKQTRRNVPTFLFKSLAFNSILLALLVCCGCSSGTWGEKIKSHLQSSDAGSLVWEAMEAHGGFDTWMSNGALQFRWTYRMQDLGPEAIVDTVQIFNPANFQVRHEVVDSDTTFGWTGKDAWIHPADATFKPPPRFWALTPTYFVGIPFVFGDLNASFTDAPDWTFEGTAYRQVKVTFSAGDAPDDYYILLLHPETKKVHGARYIVSSPLVTDGTPKPEKLITFEKHEDVGGVMFPTYHRTFSMNGDELGEKVREAEAQGYEWKKPAPSMVPPKGSKTL